MKKKIKVAVGLSGGVDSSTAAFLLKNKGYEVVGFTLKFSPRNNRCCDLESLYQAKKLCHRLDIAHYTLDVQDFFKEKVIEYFINSYLGGFTPNPCAFCNRFIKFGWLLDKIKILDFDYLATGHYAGVRKIDNNYFIVKAKDKNKSQEYFLALLKKDVLKNIIFPLSELKKEEVIKIARKNKLLFREREESQDVCFVEGRSYKDFIKKQISPSQQQGYIKYINGDILGKHKGIYNFTYGQRSGLGISYKTPLYVVDILPQTKTIVVGERKYLSCQQFSLSRSNFFIELEKVEKIKDLKVKLRYNSSSCPCRIKIIALDKVMVYLNKPSEAVSPGQVAAFYSGDILLGGGIIEKKF